MYIEKKKRKGSREIKREIKEGGKRNKENRSSTPFGKKREEKGKQRKRERKKGVEIREKEEGEEVGRGDREKKEGEKGDRKIQGGRKVIRNRRKQD